MAGLSHNLNRIALKFMKFLVNTNCNKNHYLQSREERPDAVEEKVAGWSLNNQMLRAKVTAGGSLRKRF